MSPFSTLATYSYAVNGFTFAVDRVANSLTTGTKYRFRYRSQNALGYSPYSDNVRIGLGPLPSIPTAPSKCLSPGKNSENITCV